MRSSRRRRRAALFLLLSPAQSSSLIQHSFSSLPRAVQLHLEPSTAEPPCPPSFSHLIQSLRSLTQASFCKLNSKSFRLPSHDRTSVPFAAPSHLISAAVRRSTRADFSLVAVGIRQIHTIEEYNSVMSSPQRSIVEVSPGEFLEQLGDSAHRADSLSSRSSGYVSSGRTEIVLKHRSDEFRLLYSTRDLTTAFESYSPPLSSSASLSFYRLDSKKVVDPLSSTSHPTSDADALLRTPSSPSSPTRKHESSASVLRASARLPTLSSRRGIWWSRSTRRRRRSCW